MTGGGLLMFSYCDRTSGEPVHSGWRPSLAGEAWAPNADRRRAGTGRTCELPMCGRLSEVRRSSRRKRGRSSAWKWVDSLGWEEVDEGWGRKALDYAYLFEAQMWPEYAELLDACSVAEQVSMLDIACGPGLALAMAADRGAVVAGIDASERLAAVARVRVPGGDVRVGDMFALPWGDDSFDVVTSFRGIWGGCDAALAEAVRVCRPGGSVALSFWGNPKNMDAYPLLKLFARVDDHDYAHAKEMANLSWPGVAEAMMTEAGLDSGTRWSKRIPLAYPDPEIAARAFASAGPSYLAIKTMGEDAFLEAATEGAQELLVPGGGVRFHFDVEFLVGTRPATGMA